MTARRTNSQDRRPANSSTNGKQIAAPARRFARTDGRFDLPVVTGRTPQQVARRLA